VVLGRLHPHLFNRKRPVNFTLSSRNRLRPRHRLAGCLMERVEVDGPFPYVSPQALNDCVIDVSMRGHQNESLTRLIAGWLRFFTLTQSGDRPARYGRSRRFDTRALQMGGSQGPPETGPARSRLVRTGQRRCHQAGALVAAISFLKLNGPSPGEELRPSLGNVDTGGGPAFV
jgi:hypothetical protein